MRLLAVCRYLFLIGLFCFAGCTAFAAAAEAAKPFAKAEKPAAAGQNQKSKAPFEGMALVKGGCFDMGDTFGDTKKADFKGAPETPHRVCLGDFHLDKKLVTRSQYLSLAGNDPSTAWDQIPCDICPVETVTWNDADAFCKKAGKRLPTEAEWEYAAREGGKKIRYGTGKNTIKPTEANYVFSKMDKTTPVGIYPPNALGLTDMAGNVWQWVGDWFGKDYYKISPKDDPWGPESGDTRVFRGGSFRSGEPALRASGRNSSKPQFISVAVGFRCAR